MASVTRAGVGTSIETAEIGADQVTAAKIAPGALTAADAAADLATQAELDAHEADTTAVHGIANTANVVLKGATTYTVTNGLTDRAYDANATTLDEIADVLGTLIADLRTLGVVL